MNPEPEPLPGERVFTPRDNEPLIEYFRWKDRLRLAEARQQENIRSYDHITSEVKNHEHANKS